jgi:hypothetical protein
MSDSAFLTRYISLGLLLGVSLAQAISPKLPDHTPWGKFLSKYVDTTNIDGLHRVRYSAVTPADKADLKEYLKTMQSTLASSLAKPDERAFWINLYNAKTVNVVLDNYPLKSVRDIKLPGSSTAGPWDAKSLKVEGQDLSLNDIENGILRARWKDNRIHFALNCASIGCPNLGTKAFTGINTEKMLDAGAKEFLKSKRAVSLGDGKLKLSSIFDWYRSDFGSTEKEVLTFLSEYTSAEVANQLGNWAGKVEYAYDWNLNGL